MVVMKGLRPAKTHEGRATLTSRPPYATKLYHGLDLDGVDVNGLTQFLKWVWSERDDWTVRRPSKGLFGGRRLGRHEADKALRLALASQEVGGAE